MNKTIASSVLPASLAQFAQENARQPSFFTALAIILVCLIVGIVNPVFFQLSNLFDIARASVVVGLFALGVLFVLAAGGLDVSFTAIAAFCMYSITKIALLYWPTASFSVMLLAAGFGGAVFGFLNGVLVTWLTVPSLIVTIGTQYVYRGALLTFVGTALFTNIPESLEIFGRSSLITANVEGGGVTSLPAFFLVLVAGAVMTWWLLSRTLIGRAIYAVGGNADIARRLGFNVRFVNYFVFSYAGLLAGVAGIVHVASNRLANPFDLNGMELNVIAAVVLGGARITGGYGSVVGTLMGVVLVVLINNVLILVGIPSTWQKIIIGGFIVVAGAFFAVRTPSH